jgi:hypothetical protein
MEEMVPQHKLLEQALLGRVQMGSPLTFLELVIFMAVEVEVE